MGGIVLMNLKGNIIEGVNKRLQEMDNNFDKIDFLSEFLHDTLAYLDEEELNEVKGWTEKLEV